MLAFTLLALLSAEPPRCTGRQVPPVGYLQKTVILPKGPDALEEAKHDARRQLVAQVCTGSDCEALDARVLDWVAAEEGERVCATAVLEEADLRAWREELSASKVADQLRAVVVSLFGAPPDAGAPPGKGKKAAPLKVAVVVGNVHDDGAAGSLRALWVAHKMEAALTEAGVTRVAPPPGWAGRAVPPGASALLAGDVLSREEKGRRYLDVTWTALYPDGTAKTSPPVSMLASVAPKGPSKVEPVPSAPVVQLEVEDQATHHGAMCNGQKTQLYLSAKEDRCVLIFDVYGDTGLLIFPNEARRDCTVRKGERLKAAGDEGFAVLLDPKVETERFIVVSAPSREALPPLFRGLSGTCRLDAPQLKAVRAKDLEVERAEASFRVLPERSEDCAAVPRPDKALFLQAQQDLARVPVCRGAGAR